MAASASATLSKGHRAEDFSVDGHGQLQIGDRHYYPSTPTPASRFHNKHFEVPRNASPVFTGREEIGKLLQARCLPSNTPDIQSQQRRFVIYGLGGSGKTQVCLKFAEDHRDKLLGIFWMDASSSESLERGYLQVAKVCGLESDTAAVRRWLTNLSEPWALILDNADDPGLDISSYFPVGNRGVVLITTRNPDCKIHATVGSYQLGAMATDEAVTLLLKTAGIPDVSDRSTREAAAQVIQTLGCLALAITQAGAVIRQGRCEIAEYCTLYSRRRKELLSEKAIQGGEDYRYTVYTTWEVSRQMIEEMSSEAGRDALELLQVFSFFHYEGIPEEIFYRAWCGLQMEERQSDWLLSHQLNMLLRQLIQEWDISPLRAAVSVLQSFSLVHRDQNHLISIHPLVHAWARDRLIASDEDLIWTQATSTIALSVPWTFQTADYRFRRYLVPQVDACQSFRKDGIFFLLQGIREDCLWMASSFALVYSDMGRLQEALQLRERVVEAYRRTLGDEHPNTISSIYHLALSYRPIGRYQEALQLLERSVEANKRTLGDEHRHTLLSIQSLALIYAEVGRPQEAIRLLERLVEANKRTLGDEHPDTLASRHDPAFTYTDSHVGGYQEALLLLKRVVEAEKKTLGDEHPDTLHSMYMLAFTYSNRDIGRYQEALPLFERVVEGRKKTRGDEHPDTLKAIRVLAVTYCHSDLRRYREALPLFERVVEARKKTLGDEHPDTLESIYALVFTYSEAGRRPEALQLLEQVIEAEKRTLGDEDSATVSSIALLTSLKEETFEQLPETDQRLQLPEPEISVGRSKNQKGASHSHLTRLWKKLVQQHRTKERRREDIE